MTTIHPAQRNEGINPKALYWKVRNKRLKEDAQRQMCAILPAGRHEILYWMSKGRPVFRHNGTFYISLGTNPAGQHGVLEADAPDVHQLIEDGDVELQGMVLRLNNDFLAWIGDAQAA